MLVHHVTPCDKSRTNVTTSAADAGTSLSRLNLISGLKIQNFVIKCRNFVMKLEINFIMFLEGTYDTGDLFMGGFNT